MAVNSKNKGNTFERKISKILSERFEEHTGIAAAFRRNIDSGSFFGASNQRRIETHGTEHANFGDILTPEDFKFAVECKHYKTPPTFGAIIKGEYKLFDTWIDQAKQDAENAGKFWMIISKFNNVEEFVIIQPGFVSIQPKVVMRYKGSDIVPLKALLTEPDYFFFTTSLTKDEIDKLLP
jgi:hypothetical protein